jgi:hypothetical protein
MTNPFKDAVELLLIMKKRKWEGKNFQCHGQDLKAIIAALSACRGLADGSEVIVKADYRKTLMEEAARALQNIDQFDGCEKLGFMDFETGVRECALDVRGGNCLCAERDEAITKAVEKIRALAKTEKGD